MVCFTITHTTTYIKLLPPFFPSSLALSIPSFLPPFLPFLPSLHPFSFLPSFLSSFLPSNQLTKRLIITNLTLETTFFYLEIPKKLIMWQRDGLTDGRTNGQTDRATCRVACMRLKLYQRSRYHQTHLGRIKDEFECFFDSWLPNLW